ncbi:hypothetical protein WJX72_008319 [[Myrmecia] bisecta]|uniref:Uncharacterized protein n=1 Tax=[Myrmecia] bisecta TaxID=41462 RepID=A0AAW1PGT1_9CHLO
MLHNTVVWQPRRELIFQARAHLARWGVKAGTVMAGENGDSSAAVQVASMKTLCSRRLSDAPDLVIVDEAHYSVANMYTSLFKRYPSAQILGCTATPYRLDGKGLGMLFDTLLCGPSIAKLIEQGHLVPPKLVEAGISFHKLNKVAVKMGDYVASKTKQSERDAAIAAFGAGEIQLLVSCDIISEGLDVPGIEAIVLVRPTQSYGLYIQQVGRGLRPSPGKEDCLVLDLVGNVAYHGPPTQSLRLGLTMDVTEQTGLKLVPEARPVQADQDRDCARLAMEERMENFRVQAARKSAYRELYRPLQELMPWLEEQALHAGWDKPNDWQLVWLVVERADL